MKHERMFHGTLQGLNLHLSMSNGKIYLIQQVILNDDLLKFLFVSGFNTLLIHNKEYSVNIFS